ncbi:hypothetical protein D7322_05440 [Sphingobacterium puteale]|uniref:Uncharacterized protein n=1 Tax=Sphingobacterium puteale TaxID=2420510 RepID=A0A420W2U3_9SPHI|nr:hypothetical protein D7322_05440 [Sphingobacterium puteale]
MQFAEQYIWNIVHKLIIQMKGLKSMLMISLGLVIFFPVKRGTQGHKELLVRKANKAKKGYRG